MSAHPKLLLLLAAATLTLGACAAPEDEDVDESEGELNGYGSREGREIPPSEVARLVRAAGFPETIVGTMVCTAKYESSFFERASHRNKNRSVDRGLFQINSIHLGGTRGCPTEAEALFDAETNTKCAFAVYQGRQRSADDPRVGLSAWYAYRSHKAECDSFPAPSDDDSLPTTTAPEEEPEDTTPEEQPAGSCWAGTLRKNLEPGGCYQRKSDGVWFQCKDGLWYRNVTNGAGPFGACTSEHPLP